MGAAMSDEIAAKDCVRIKDHEAVVLVYDNGSLTFTDRGPKYVQIDGQQFIELMRRCWNDENQEAIIGTFIGNIRVNGMIDFRRSQYKSLCAILLVLGYRDALKETIEYVLVYDKHGMRPSLEDLTESVFGIRYLQIVNKKVPIRSPKKTLIGYTVVCGM